VSWTRGVRDPTNDFVYFMNMHSLGPSFQCHNGLASRWTSIHSFIHSTGMCSMDDSLPFSGASSTPLCYIPFPSTLFHQLVYHPPSLQLAIHFLVCWGADKSLALPGINKLMFLSEWREFPSAPCLAGGEKTWWLLASRYCWNRECPWHAFELVSFPVGLRTYQHPGTSQPYCFQIHMQYFFGNSIFSHSLHMPKQT